MKHECGIAETRGVFTTPFYSSLAGILRKARGQSKIRSFFEFGTNAAMRLHQITNTKHKTTLSNRHKMHACRLAELGSWVATNSGALIYGNEGQPLLVASSYWIASKNRAQRWITAIKMFEKDIQQPQPNHDPWAALEIVIQEIIQAELLTRVWSATVLSHDWYRRSDELHGLAHSVHLSHTEVKNRAFRLMLDCKNEDVEAVQRLNGLRLRIERWTDVFLGQLPFKDIATQFAFDKNRVIEFHTERQEALGEEMVTRQHVFQASFATDLLRNQAKYSANPGLNQDIAAGVLACFPTDRFDSLGLPKSIKLAWIEKAHHDTQMLVDHLIEFDYTAETGASRL